MWRSPTKLILASALLALAGCVAAPVKHDADTPQAGGPDLVIDANHVAHFYDRYGEFYKVQIPGSATGTSGGGGGGVTVSGTPTAGNCAKFVSGKVIQDSGGLCGGTGAPGGVNGQLQINSTGSFGGITLGGDCTFATPNITCTKTNGTAFGTFATANAATPPAIGGTTPAGGAFTTLSASSTVSGTGFSTYLASPPAIGGTAAAAGSFTTLSATGALTTNVTGGGTQCLHASNTGVVTGTGSDCGSGGSASFSSITTGTNTVPATMTVGNGSVMTVSGTGINNANEINGQTVPASAGLLGSNASSQLVAVTGGGCVSISGNVVSLLAPINPQTGTSYTIASTDACGLVTLNNAAAIAVTVPQATGTFGTNFSFDVQDLGAGTATLTPTTSTINGAATLAIPQNTGCTVTSDGTNWQVSSCTALSGGSGGGIGSFYSFGSSSQAQSVTNYDWYNQNSASNVGIGGLAPVNGTIKNLQLWTTNAPAAGQTFTATVYSGSPGSPTASSVTCQIGNPNHSCNSSSLSAAISAGQQILVQIVTSATSGATGAMFLGLEVTSP